MGRLTFALRVAVACLLFAGAVRPADSQTAPSKTPGGTVKRITVHGKSLEGNLQSESADREVTIYLPPGYDTNLNRRYPVVYLLHGYGLTDQVPGPASVFAVSSAASICRRQWTAPLPAGPRAK